MYIHDLLYSKICHVDMADRFGTYKFCNSSNNRETVI